jgi:sugar lactone lactonase YvrE
MLGSGSWTQNGANSGSAAVLNLNGSSIASFCFDNNNVMWVADRGNNRVLGFKPEVFYGSIGGNASYVIGQPNFTSSTAQTLSAQSLFTPLSVAIDKNGYLWVSDTYYTEGNRILGYKNPYGVNVAADYVIGQPNFTTSNYGATQNQFSSNISTIAFDNSGNLWVYDYYRILGFASTDLYGNNQPNASWLMFQTSYTAELTSTLSQGYTMQYDMAGFFYRVAIPNEEIVTALPNPYQIDYGNPLYLAFNSENDMWISDINNYRLVQYKNSDITSNVYPYNCSAVLGQSQFYIQGKTGETQYNLDYVRDVAFDKNNNLWIADSFSIKGFQYPNYSQQVMQNWVIGGTFTTTGGLTQYGLSQPQTVSFDNFGNMYVSDCSQNRIMGFSASSLYGNNEPNAFVVIGQANFTTGTAATTQSGLNLNIGNQYYELAGKVAFDANNNMYVADTANNRIMIFLYGSGFTNGMNASVVLGQTGFTTATVGDTSAELVNPAYLIFDSQGNLWVSDRGNSRVQKFVPPFTTGMAATVSITGFNNPSGLVFDKMGNLLVADNTNSRILGFPPSALNATTTISSATIVLGQPNFTSVTRGLGIQALNYPQGLAINPATGDLMCADNQNNRIVGWYYLHKQTQSNPLNSKYIFYNE